MMNGCEGRRGGCKDHPYDKQTPGVCSSCLREKLSKLYNTNPIIYPPSFSPNSPSSPYSPQTTQPFSSSSSATTTDSSSSRGSSSHHHHRRRFRRNASHAAEPAVTSCMVTLNLKKSKSLAFASRNRIRERDVTHVSARKKDGFWAKVLKLKKREPLVTT